ncbi:hypothetical protein J1605_018371 [Eschrichtius robustus]|uniref:Uncharacterized protein n=1 Tax=Eschrichtius robustus TaxID=9764 RepID=A0AB34HR82_ESCRO|nr:hypothetical protein J1605_018371 [Eschrichtius robustus]
MLPTFNQDCAAAQAERRNQPRGEAGKGRRRSPGGGEAAAAAGRRGYARTRTCPFVVRRGRVITWRGAPSLTAARRRENPSWFHEVPGLPRQPAAPLPGWSTPAAPSPGDAEAGRRRGVPSLASGAWRPGPAPTRPAPRSPAIARPPMAPPPHSEAGGYRELTRDVTDTPSPGEPEQCHLWVTGVSCRN